MGLPKGRTNNPKGMPKGIKHKKTKEWEALGEMITGHCAGNVNTYLQELWQKDKEAYFRAFVMLIEYFKPKIARTEITGKDGAPMEQKIDLSILPKETLRKLLKKNVD